MKNILTESLAANIAAAIILTLVFVFAIDAVVNIAAPLHPRSLQKNTGGTIGGTVVPERNSADNNKLFKKNCYVCHTSKKGARDKTGPNLWGIIGRDKAARKGYRYSKALRSLTGKWTEPEIGQFIASPKAFAPGTKMGFRGIRDRDKRQGIVDYLRLLADFPSATTK